MKIVLEVITIAHPGEGSGRPATVSQSHTVVSDTTPGEGIPYLTGENIEEINSYESVPTRGGGKVEIFRNIIKI